MTTGRWSGPRRASGRWSAESGAGSSGDEVRHVRGGRAGVVALRDRAAGGGSVEDEWDVVAAGGGEQCEERSVGRRTGRVDLDL
jgi:hypothetical protein